MTNASCNVLVVGAGPAGMASAWAATQNRGGRSVVAVLDDNPAAGGQIWRGESTGVWFGRFRSCGAELLSGTRLLARIGPQRLLTEAGEIGFEQLIFATGARERFLPFPGWTLPGVMGAGGLQAMAKGGMPIEGKRVVVAGTGPLLLAVAAYLKQQGARVLHIAEQTPFHKLRLFGHALLGEPAKLAQGAGLGWTLAGTPFRTSSWPVRRSHTGAPTTCTSTCSRPTSPAGRSA